MLRTTVGLWLPTYVRRYADKQTAIEDKHNIIDSASGVDLNTACFVFETFFAIRSRVPTQQILSK